MFEHLSALLTSGETNAGTLAIFGIGVGVFITVLGLSGALAPKDPVLQ